MAVIAEPHEAFPGSYAEKVTLAAREAFCNSSPSMLPLNQLFKAASLHLSTKQLTTASKFIFSACSR